MFLLQNFLIKYVLNVMPDKYWKDFCRYLLGRGLFGRYDYESPGFSNLSFTTLVRNLTLILPKPKVPLPLVQSKTSLHICAVWPSSILLADQLQGPILISLKMITDSSKNGRWIIPFKKFSRLRVKSLTFVEDFHLNLLIKRIRMKYFFCIRGHV